VPGSEGPEAASEDDKGGTGMIRIGTLLTAIIMAGISAVCIDVHVQNYTLAVYFGLSSLIIGVGWRNADE
jgi:hypothetical protein